MKRSQRLLAALLIFLALVYYLGPRPRQPVFETNWPEKADLATVQQALEREQTLPLKPGNGMEVIWASQPNRRTGKSLLYLHGFSASHEEGSPVHREVARAFGMNLLLSRLCDHGLAGESALNSYTADCLWESGKEALNLALALGDTVVIMGTSTGASLALQLAATYPDKVFALLLISPNIEVNDPNAWLLNNPWGLQIARLVFGGENREIPDQTDYVRQYWDTRYRLEAIVQLEEYLESAMTPATFAAVRAPVFMASYFENEEVQDDVVRVDAQREMFQLLGTPTNLKQKENFGTGGHHVLANPKRSLQAGAVRDAVLSFCTEVLGFRRI